MALILFDHRVWVLASDGDIQEGISHEASSMAGHLGLGKLNVIYDANEITIDGPLSLSMSEDVAKRYDAYGWQVLHVEDGNDLPAIYDALTAAKANESQPTLILARTNIGYGSPNKQDSSKSHGSPLGEEEVRLTKENLGWPLEPTFHVPQEAREAFAQLRDRGGEAYEAWAEARQRYVEAHPELAGELERRQAGDLPENLAGLMPGFDESTMATRKSSGAVLNAIGESLPELIGGSADLTGSNNTYFDGLPEYTSERPARNLRYGIREHAMGAAMNGMALSGLLRPFGGTFLIFSDYLRPALRLSALMGTPVVWVFTHDSIFLGEDWADAPADCSACRAASDSQSSCHPSR